MNLKNYINALKHLHSIRRKRGRPTDSATDLAVRLGFDSTADLAQRLGFSTTSELIEAHAAHRRKRSKA